MKWYEEKDLDNGIVLSSRIRLARNLAKYPFPNMLNAQQCDDLIKEVKSAIKDSPTYLKEEFDYIDMNTLDDVEKLSLIEKHLISPNLAIKKDKCGTLLQNDHSVSILVNEEDHLRIQVILKGNNIDEAFSVADKIDDLLEERLVYAFHNDYGYLTSCLTNTGTGLRASFMLHLPVLEKTGRIREISQNVSKFGMTIRGIYGEGSEPLGSIYQISNQITLGLSEEEIISNLKNITNQITNLEKRLREEIIKNHKLTYEDKIYRSYGILKNCKKISSEEGMNLLSDVMLGKEMKIISLDNLQTNLYNIMMNIQVGSLQKNSKMQMDENMRDIKRAEYLNKIL